MDDFGEDLTESPYIGPVRLEQGVLLKDLRNKMGVEFTLDSSQVESLEREDEFRVDKCFDFDDFSPYINLECVSGDSNENSTLTPFEALRQNMTKLTDDEKVFKRIIKEGSGETLPDKAVVYFHYNSYLEMEEVPFDSSPLRNKKPVRTQLGDGTLYAGFEISLSSMKVGEKAQFLVDPDYAFGAMGSPPRIPPNATILTEIEVYKVVDCGQSVDNIDLPQEEKQSFAVVIKKAKAFHLLGNDCFAERDIHKAVQNYKKAENVLLGCKMENDDEEERYGKLLLKIYTNLCVCYNHPKLKMPERVCLAAREAFYTVPNEAKKSPKLFFNLGKAHMSLNDWGKAGRNLKKALNFEPHNSDVIKHLEDLEMKKKKYYAHEKITYQKAFKFSKNDDSGDAKDASETKEDNQKTDDEVDEVSESFRDVLRLQLEEFSRRATNLIQLPPGLTREEKNLCRQISEELGLVYNETTICAKENISISRK